MSKSLAALAAAATALFLTATRAEAEVTATPLVFTAVDAVSVQGVNFTITGVVQGDPAATDHAFALSGTFSSGTDVRTSGVVDVCQRLAVVAMSAPGQYLFEVFWTSVLSYPRCKLSRVNP